MNQPDWQRVRAVFESVVDLPRSEAESALNHEHDALVRAEVLSLLAHHASAGDFLQTPVDLTSLRHGRLVPGSRLGAYTIEREIGVGGMGEVYLATDTRLHRRVCLKFVRSDFANDVRYLERLRREAQLAASITHPGVCAVYALESEHEALFLVTEFVEGRTLRQEIDEHTRPSTAQVVQTMTELAHALAAAHAKGVVHRDLTPDNVMHSTEGHVKVLDFGIARQDGAVGGSAPLDARAWRTEPGVVVGTLRYMSPEQLSGAAVDVRADVFALGVLVYEFATGTHPFEGSSPLVTTARILEQAPAPLMDRRGDLPRYLAEVVARCLEKEPARRPRDAGAIVEALAAGHTAWSERQAQDVPLSARTTGELGAVASVAQLEVGARPVNWSSPVSPDNPVDTSAGATTGPRPRWWYVHQGVLIALYFLSCVAAWQVTQWDRGASARWVFLVIGLVSAVGGVIRGHLLFTAWAHRARLGEERRRTKPVLRWLDLFNATALAVAALLLPNARVVTTALTLGLAAGLATAALLIEPSTTAAAFDDVPTR